MIIKIITAALLSSSVGYALYRYLSPSDNIDLRLKIIEELKKYADNLVLQKLSPEDSRLCDRYHKQLASLNHLEHSYKRSGSDLPKYIREYAKARTIKELNDVLEKYPYQ